MILYALKRSLFLFVLAAAVFAATGCVMQQPFVRPNPANPIASVAVLPMYNATNDVGAPQLVREMVQERLKHLQYDALDLKEVDARLRDQMGVTLGAQLELTTPEKVGEALGTDAVLYGYLLNFEDLMTGVYNVKKVRAGFKLIETKSGRVIWSGGLGVKSDLTSAGLIGEGVAGLKDRQDKREGLSEYASIKGIEGIPHLGEWQKLSHHSDKKVGEAAMLALGERLLTTALNVHLKYEADNMLGLIFRSMIAGPGRVGSHSRALGVVQRIEVEAPPPPVERLDNEMPPLRGVTVLRDPTALFFEYQDLGDVDFVADTVMTVERPGSLPLVISGTVAKRGGSIRRTNITPSLSDRAGPNGRPEFRSVVIQRPDQSKVFVLYPDLGAFVAREMGNRNNHTVRMAGQEAVNGRMSDKLIVTFLSPEGERSWTVWQTRDRRRTTLKAEITGNGIRVAVDFRNIRFTTPPPNIFNVPPNLRRAESEEEIIGERR